jgi:hypothetical protein
MKSYQILGNFGEKSLHWRRRVYTFLMENENHIQRTARCACQRAEITVCGEPEMHGVCHCSNCKRRTGSAFGISAYFPKVNVMEKKGEMRVFAFRHAAQNHDQARHFCTHCGTTLYWTISTLPDLIGIAGGCFAGCAPLSPPTMSVQDDDCVEWVTLPQAWKRATLK